MEKRLIDYIREQTGVNYADSFDYLKDLKDCDNELRGKYLYPLLMHLIGAEMEEGQSEELPINKKTFNMIQEYSNAVDELYAEVQEKVGVDEADELISKIDDLKFKNLGITRQDLLDAFSKEPKYINGTVLTDVPTGVKLYPIADYDNGLTLCVTKSDGLHLATTEVLEDVNSKFKYGKYDTVTLKEDFEGCNYDEFGEVTKTTIYPKNSKGTIVELKGASADWQSNYYVIEFFIDGERRLMPVVEENMEENFILE